MDQKYFSEIKARANKKLTGKNKFHGYIATKSSKHGEGVYDAIINRLYQCEYEDIPALIAEVERLTIENLGLKDAAIRCDGYEKRYHAALTELDTKDQQIAMLKKALELAIRKIGHCGNCDQNCMFCALKDPEYFIHQAQEQEEA